MEWLVYVSYFFGGFFLSNAIPHIASGTMGQAFQSPFAKPPGKGLSSSMVNVFWGTFNIVIAYLLIVRVGDFDLHDNVDVVLLGAGFLLKAIGSAYQFGKFHGGNSPLKQ